jgi:hypothetical protein
MAREKKLEIKEVPQHNTSPLIDEQTSSIAPEQRRLEDMVRKILDSMDSIDPMEAEDLEEQLKLTLGLQKLAENMPKLLMALEELRNKHKLKKEDIKGNKSLSPLEDGTLDDD